MTEAAPSADRDLLQGVDRHLQQYAVTRKVTPTSDACYTCGGSGHRSRECATRNRATAICYRCGGSDQRTQTGSYVATVGVRGDRGYSVQLPFECRAPMAISSDSRDSDCDRTNVESFSGCRSLGFYVRYQQPQGDLGITATIYTVVTVAIYPAVMVATFPVITGNNLSREPSSPLSREPSLRERPTRRLIRQTAESTKCSSSSRGES